ncbi:MAG: hypothetical protein Q8M15_13495 [Bacteroidota bacterium]|nr:hypothetical protein [Bacteroidota bacterium]
MKSIFAESLFFFSFLFIINSCGNNPKSSSRMAIVEGQINPVFTKGKYIYFYQFTDSLSLFFYEKKATDSCILNPDGSFKIEIANWPKSGFFDLGTRELVFARNYFLEPGDHLKLIFDGNEMPLKLNTYKGIGKYNNFLQVFNDTFYRSPVVKRNYFVISNYMLAPDYAVYIGKRKKEQFDFYKNYFRNQEIDSTFQTYFEKETEYNWANDKTYFLWKKRTRHEEVPLDTSYFDFLQVISTDDPKALICPGYTRFIELYINELYQLEIQKKIFKLSLALQPSLEKSFLAKKHLQGTGLKIAFYQILRDEIYSVDAHLTKNRKMHFAFIDSLTNIAYEATKDSAILQYVNSQK